MPPIKKIILLDSYSQSSIKYSQILGLISITTYLHFLKIKLIIAKGY